MAAALFWERNTAVCKTKRKGLVCRSRHTDDHGRLVKRGRGEGESPHFFFSVISQLRSKRRQSLASSPLDTHNWATPKPSPRRRRGTPLLSCPSQMGEKKKKLPHKTSPQSLSHSRQLSSTWQSRDSHALCGSFCIDEGRSLVPSIAATGRLVSGS